jgi:thiol-disulfide isomerase/thioredoxin
LLICVGALDFFMGKLLFLLALFICGGTKAQEHGVSGAGLTTIDGKKFVVDLKEVSVIVFLSASCPLSQKYTLTLNEMAKEFGSKVKFYGVFTDDGTYDDYKNFRTKYKIPFSLLVDKKKQLVKSLAANVTPEAFVLQKEKVIYHGAIDDWVIELGKTKNRATINFVRNAVQCAMANTTPFPNYQKPVGCFID